MSIECCTAEAPCCSFHRVSDIGFDDDREPLKAIRVVAAPEDGWDW